MLAAETAVLPTKSTAWQLGVEKFISALPAEHRVAFRAPACADDCFQLIQCAAVRNRKFDRFAIILRPLVEPLKKFEASVDVLVQTYSTFASPVWGPLRVVITLLCERLSTLSVVTTLLERLVEPLRRFRNYEYMFEHDCSLQSAIGALYCDLIEFCACVVSHSSKKPLFKKFGSFDRDVVEISDKIRHHWTEVDVAANAANLIEAKAARQAEEVSKAQELRRDINRWLVPSTVEDDLYGLQADYMEGSCDWILRSKEFEGFMESRPSRRALRISSHPGGGKSTTASFLVRHLKSSAENIVLYFFCKATNSEKAFALNILRTFMWQLLQYDKSLYEVLLPSYQRSGRTTADSESEIFSLFNLLARKITTSPIFMVLDALDECHDATKLLSLLEDKHDESLPLAFILSARDDPALGSLVHHCSYSITLHSRPEPLREYIQQRVAALDVPLTAGLRGEILDKITKASDGLWLFARLILDEISQAPTHEEIHNQLAQIPTGLAELYTAIIKKKESKFTKSQLKMVQQIYLWVDTSAYIPPALWKASASNLCDDMISVILKSTLRSNSPLLRPMNLVQTLTSPLIHTRLLHEPFHYHFTDGTTSVDHPNFTAEFFHQTAKQYLSWADDEPLSQIPRSLQPRRLAPLHRGIAAIWYFSDSLEFQYALQHLRERPRSGTFDCWVEMSCALWQCLKLYAIPNDSDKDEMAEVGELCAQLSHFMTTDQCLGFVEASVILHFSQRSVVLLENTGEAQSPLAVQQGAFAQMLDKRKTFCEDLGWAVVSRWPEEEVYHSIQTSEDNKNGQAWLEKYSQKPAGFDRRPLARKMDALARQYQWLLLAPGARSSNCFMLTGKG